MAIYTVEKIWEWSAEEMSVEEINELLLAKDDMEQTDFHIAAEDGKTQVLKEIWEWSTVKLSA